TQLGKINLILGWTWLFKHNPEIDWQTGVVTLSRCPQECENLGKPSRVRQTEHLEKINCYNHTIFGPFLLFHSPL
ncbi:hypothetical protein SERLA73DRAFT_60278, partial [Serpula lacrymans var. lacrymans S7.3]